MYFYFTENEFHLFCIFNGAHVSTVVGDASSTCTCTEI